MSCKMEDLGRKAAEGIYAALKERGLSSYVDYGHLSIIAGGVHQAIAAAREEGRAAGYGEAIEKAEKAAESLAAHYDRLRHGESYERCVAANAACVDVADAIRALALPVDKTKP